MKNNYNEYLELLNSGKIKNVQELTKKFDHDEKYLSELEYTLALFILDNQEDEAKNNFEVNISFEDFQADLVKLLNSDISFHISALIQKNEQVYKELKLSKHKSLNVIASEISVDLQDLDIQTKKNILFDVLNENSILGLIDKDLKISILDKKAKEVIKELSIELNDIDDSILSLTKIDSSRDYSVILSRDSGKWLLEKKGKSKLSNLTQGFEDFIENLSKNINFGTARKIAVGLAIGASVGFSGNANAYMNDLESSLKDLNTVVSKKITERYGECKTGLIINSKNKVSLNFTLYLGNHFVDGNVFGYNAGDQSSQERNIKLGKMKDSKCDISTSQARIIYKAVNEIVEAYK